MDANGYDIARGARLQDAWLVGMNNRIYRWTESGWGMTSGERKRVACDPDENAWVIGRAGKKSEQKNFLLHQLSESP